jgi:DNA-binding transcriptional LysR family regulator
MEIAKDPIVVAMPRNHPLGHHKVVSRDDLAREQLLLIEDGHCLRSHSLQACRIVDPVRNEVLAKRRRTLKRFAYPPFLCAALKKSGPGIASALEQLRDTAKGT